MPKQTLSLSEIGNEKSRFGDVFSKLRVQMKTARLGEPFYL